MTYQHLNERIQDIDQTYPFSMNPNVLLPMLLIFMFAVIIFFNICIWGVYKIKGTQKKVKPLVKILTGNPRQRDLQIMRQVFSSLFEGTASLSMTLGHHSLPAPLHTSPPLPPPGPLNCPCCWKVLQIEEREATHEMSPLMMHNLLLLILPKCTWKRLYMM